MNLSLVSVLIPLPILHTTDRALQLSADVVYSIRITIYEYEVSTVPLIYVCNSSIRGYNF